jgi:predicted Zn-ribbon and HTH transcriptional regulator
MKTIKELKCKRCGYEWIPRSYEKPNRCANPKCRSPYWDKDRRVKK